MGETDHQYLKDIITGQRLHERRVSLLRRFWSGGSLYKWKSTVNNFLIFSARIILEIYQATMKIFLHINGTLFIKGEKFQALLESNHEPLGLKANVLTAKPSWLI